MCVVVNVFGDLYIYINSIYMKTLVLNNEKFSRLKKNGNQKIAARLSSFEDYLVLKKSVKKDRGGKPYLLMACPEIPRWKPT